MAIFSIPDIKIAGIAASVPKKEVSTRDYNLLSEKEQENFIKIIGVEKRRVADPGIATSDLSFEAAKQLIEGLGWDPEEVELLIFVSQSRDYLIPATAGILQNKLGLPKTCMALDISLGCSGYVYGLSVMGRMMSGGAIKKGLFLVGDVSTQNTSYKDKSTYPLFGDAGTATALEYVPGAPDMAFNLQTDGSGYEAIIIPDGGIRNFATKETSFEYEDIAEGISRNKFHIALNGEEVFNFSLREVAPNIRALLEYSGMELEVIDYFVTHQANKLMNESIRKKLKIDPAKYPYSIRNFGNTSSASIPLTIVTALQDEVTGKELKLLLSGFGVGLSWGSAVLNTDKIFCPALIEI
ncbi:MAG: ketoacyl-ACP synthase III [Bacteroidetes bacterium]|nr:MAG: ketoacyl-ACP synthase III [Bacteroidota bacterium]